MEALPERFNNPFRYAPHPLIREAAERMLSRIDSDPVLRAAFSEGKMLGVMLATDPEGLIHTLYGFSGSVRIPDGHGGTQLSNHLEGFVPPVFDLLDPDGHFKLKEKEISELNLLIYKAEKSGRNSVPPKDGRARNDNGVWITELKARRRELSEYLQKWIFDRYVLLNARGERRSISSIAVSRGSLPPGGTGDCALPKLLQYAYLNGLRPRLFGEFWYGAPEPVSVRVTGRFYPSCSGKCGFILPYMLEGLGTEDEGLPDSAQDFGIIYEDEHILVVNKPSGMLSVPGRSAGRESLLGLLQRRENSLNGCTGHKGPKIFPVHRLDMDTAGLMVFARTAEAQVSLRRQFEERTVSKTYLARVEAPVDLNLNPGDEGLIDLPLLADFEDRPRQKVDFEDGKRAVTGYEVLKRYDDGGLLLRFRPETGRTHQLRVHSAHHRGIGAPISGDRLYGSHSGNALCLLAESLSFTHPSSMEPLSFSLDPPSWAE